MTVKSLQARCAALEELLPQLVGKYTTEDQLLAFARALASVALPITGKLTPIQGGALLDSIKHMLGLEHNIESLRGNARRILANWSFIKDGIMIPYWDGSNTESEVVFIGVTRMPVAENSKPKYLVKIKLKTGLCAGIISCACLYAAALKRFLNRIGGCKKFNCTPEEIAGMQARVVVSLKNDYLKITSWDCLPRHKEHNRELCAYRRKANRCKVQGPCRDCKRTIRECPLAVWN